MTTRSMLRRTYRSPEWPRLAGQGRRRIGELGLSIALGGAIGLGVVVSSTYLAKPLLLVGLVAGCIFAVVTIRWPEIGILALVAITGGLIDTDALPFLDLGPVSFHISDLVLFLLLGLVFLRATGRRGFRLFGSPLSAPLLLFFGAVVVSVLNGMFIYGVGLNSLLRMARVLAYWLAFFPTLHLVRDERSLRRLIAGLWTLAAILIVGVVFPGSLSFLHLLPGRTVELTTAGRAIAGVTRFYSVSERLLYVMIPVAIGTLATVNKKHQLWRVGVLAGLLVWLFRSFQRNYWLTTLLGCGVLLFLLSGQERLRLAKRLLPFVMIGLVLLAATQLAQVQPILNLVHVAGDRLASLIEDPFRADPNIRWRLFENQEALQQISRHPLLGIGLRNSYRPLMAGEGGSSILDWYAHNAYLWITVMMGLLGLIPFAWLSIAYLMRVLRWWRRIPDDEFRGVYVGFGMAFMGMMVSNLVAPNFVQSWSLTIYPVMMGICEGILRVSLVGGREPAPGPMKDPMAADRVLDRAALPAE